MGNEGYQDFGWFDINFNGESVYELPIHEQEKGRNRPNLTAKYI